MKEKSIDEKLKLLYPNKPTYQGIVKEKQKTDSEADIQSRIVKWLKKEYPLIHFRTDWFAGHFCPAYVKEQFNNAQSGSGFPDLEILKRSKHYTGLHIELKLDATKVFLKDGITLAAIPQIHLQADYITYLRNEERCALFGLNEAHIKQIIVDYFGDKIIEQPFIKNKLNERKAVTKSNQMADDFFNSHGII